MFYCMEWVYWSTSSYRFRVKIAELSRFLYVWFLPKRNKLLHESFTNRLDPLEFQRIKCGLSFKSDVTCCVQWANVKVNICHLKNDSTENDVSTGGGGVTQQSFIREGFAPRSNPLPFYRPFLREKVLLSYTFYGQIVPFHILSLELNIPFTCCKCVHYL